MAKAKATWATKYVINQIVLGYNSKYEANICEFVLI